VAGDWIKVEVATPDKPEVVAMATALRKDQDAVFGKVFRVWAWADTNSVDGSAVGVTEAFIDRLTACRGFAKAMRAAGWLSGADGALIFPGFARHNGQTAKARALENRKKIAQRQREKESPHERDNHPAVVPFAAGQEGVICPDFTGTNDGTKTGTREEYKKKKKKNAPLGADPQALRDRWPGIDIDAQLALATRYCLERYGRPDFDAQWFESTWLANARSRLRGAVPANGPTGPKVVGLAEPEGWRAYVRDDMPDCAFAPGGAREMDEWDEIEPVSQRAIIEGMERAAKRERATT
jgi:hypothetical protein